MKTNFLDNLRKNPFMGIVRGLSAKYALDCAKMCVDSGLTCIEVPLNTNGACEALRCLRNECRTLGISVGAGTVRSLADLDAALGAGAEFIVSPHTDSEIVRECVTRGLPCFPGALTPSEVQQAFNLGATAVKVFPIGAMGGVSYVKELRGPFRDIPLLACGGVNEANALAYLEAGCDFLAFGGSIFSPTLMEAGQWDRIAEKVLGLRAAAGFDSPAGPR